MAAPVWLKSELQLVWLLMLFSVPLKDGYHKCRRTPQVTGVYNQCGKELKLKKVIITAIGSPQTTPKFRILFENMQRLLALKVPKEPPQIPLDLFDVTQWHNENAYVHR